MGSEKVKVYFSLLFAMTCWGFTYIWYKQVYPALTPAFVITARLVIASVLMFLYAFLSKRLMRINVSDIWLFVLLAFFEPFLYFAGESFGMKYVSSTLGSLIIATIPLFTSVASFFLFREKLSVANYAGFLISLAGVALVIKSDHAISHSSPKGVALMFGAVFAAIGYVVFLKKLIDKYNIITIIAYQSLIGLIFFIPFFLALDAGKMGTLQITPEILAPLMALGVFGSVVAFIFFIYAIRKIGVARANAFANLIPVVTALLAFFLLDEKFPRVKIYGVVLVIAGLFLSQLTALKWPDGKARIIPAAYGLLVKQFRNNRYRQV